MRVVTIKPDFDSWRIAARALLAEGTDPREILWSVDGAESQLFEGPRTDSGTDAVAVPVPRRFLNLARTVSSIFAFVQICEWQFMQVLVGGMPAKPETSTDV